MRKNTKKCFYINDFIQAYYHGRSDNIVIYEHASALIENLDFELVSIHINGTEYIKDKSIPIKLTTGEILLLKLL